MKKQFLFRMGFLILSLWVFSAQAQTRLVNQSSYSLGRPSLIYEYSRTLPIGDGSGNMVFLDNYYNSITSPDNENFDLAVFSPGTGVIGGNNFFSLHGQSDFGTNMYIHNGFLYGVGFTTDSTFTNKLNCNLIKFNLSTLDTAWTITENISGAIQQAPTSVIADDSFIYMAAAVQTSTDNKICIIKYDQSGHKIWQTDYDTTGYTAVPVAMAFSGSYVTITGFIYDNLGNSSFLTYHVVRNTGTGETPKFTANGIGAISHPVGLLTDSSRQSFIGGTSTVMGLNSVIKLVGYDSAFNSLFVSTWGDSSQSNQATSIAGENTQKHVYITGSSPNTSGGTDLIVLRYNMDGSLSWSKRMSAPNPANGMGGVSITTGQDCSAYVTGWVFNGVDTNVITAAIDSGSNILWSKTFARTFTSTDVPYSITMGDDGMTVYVTTRSIGPDSQYVMLQYKQDGTNNASDSTVPSKQWAYFENKGQIVDTGKHQVDYVRYYTNTANPRLYITDYALSYVYSWKDSTGDTLQRIDMTLEKTETGSDPNTPNYYAAEQIPFYLNYYIGGLPAFYENIHGNQRITAKKIYPSIDCQLYSDSGGLKYYYVVNPGGNPSDIQFKYTGADSVTTDTLGGLHIYSRHSVANQLPFTAWQYSGGSATQVSLTLSQIGTAEYNFSVGSYNTALPLYIRMAQQAQQAAAVDSIQNLKWSTYLGGSGGDGATDIDIDNHHQQYVTGFTQSTDFPTTTGIAFNNSAGVLGSFLTKFDSANIILYSVFYSGSTRALGTTLNIKHNSTAVAAGIYNTYDAQFQPVYIAGQTPYTDLPIPSNPLFPSGLHNGTYAGGEADGFVVLFNGFNGQLKQASYIGSDREDGINTLEIDMDTTRNPNVLYLGGYTTGTNFPFQNAFSGNFYDDQGRGVLMQLEGMNPKLATGFGSHSLYFNNGTDSVGCTINDIKLDHAGNILIVGNSYFTFPTASPYSISRPNTNSFWLSSHPNTSTPPTNAFMAKFKPGTGAAKNQYSLYYFSEYGDNEFDNGQKICANSTNDIYIAGQGFRNYLTQDTSFDYINAGQGSDGAYIVRFSSDGVLLANGDYGGCLNITFGDMFCDVEDNVFVFGGTGPNSTLFSALQKTDWYWDNYTANKCFLAEVNPSNVMTWSTLFGGRINEIQGGMCIDGNNMYITGKTSTNDAQNSGFLAFPLVSNSTATFTSRYGGDGTIGGDAFIARFNLGNLTPLTSISDVRNTHSAISCYPNPSNGKFMVSFPDFDNGDKVVTLYDYMGQSLFSAHTTNNSMEINSAEKFATGIYIIEVCSSNKKEVSKIVISHQ